MKAKEKARCGNTGPNIKPNYERRIPMERGYVKLWRKCLDSGLIRNATAWQLFGYLLLKTTHRAHRQLVGGMVFDLQPGDVIYGRKKASEELGASEQTLRTAIKLLEKLEIVTTKSTNKCTIISFVNWNRYQDEQPATNQQINQHLTSNQPAINQHLTTNKNENTKKKEEEKKESKPQAGGRENPSRTENRESYDSLIAGYTSSLELRSALGDFIVMRQRIRAPVTNAALRQTFRELDKMAGENECLKTAIVEQSVQRSWRGVFPLREEQKSQQDPWAGAI